MLLWTALISGDKVDRDKLILLVVLVLSRVASPAEEMSLEQSWGRLITSTCDHYLHI